MPPGDHRNQAAIRLGTPLFGLRQTQPRVSCGRILAILFFLAPATGLADGSAYVAPRDPANDYLDAIDNIEADFGPYATELSDLYLGLGQTLLSKGEFLKAKDAYNRGLMVVRVNSGPNSPEQTEPLFLLANIEAGLGDMNAAEEVLDNIYFINSNYYGSESPEIIPVLDRIYGWYSTARPPGSLISDYDDYDNRLKMAKHMVKASETVNGHSHPVTAAAYRRLGDAEFQMVRHLPGTGMPVNPDHYVTVTNSGLKPLGFGATPVVDHASAGRRAYQKAIESMQANPSTSFAEFAETLANLADWYLLFDKPRNSRMLYKEAFNVLQLSEEDAELAASYMNQPQPMHFIVNAQGEAIESESADLEAISLDISMTVTSLGDVRKVKALNPPESLSADDVRAIEMRIQTIPFRPAMMEGEVVTTRDFIWQFAIPAQKVTS
jgi:tetratricopeptide (TPR) repeat protein